MVAGKGRQVTQQGHHRKCSRFSQSASGDLRRGGIISGSGDEGGLHGLSLTQLLSVQNNGLMRSVFDSPREETL